MAQRAARADGGDAASELPPQAKEAWKHVYYMLGGNPRLLSYALEYMGDLGRRDMGRLQKGRFWNPGNTSLHCSCISGKLCALMHSCKVWHLRNKHFGNAAGLDQRLLGLTLNEVTDIVSAVSDRAAD